MRRPILPIGEGVQASAGNRLAGVRGSRGFSSCECGPSVVFDSFRSVRRRDRLVISGYLAFWGCRLPRSRRWPWALFHRCNTRARWRPLLKSHGRERNSGSNKSGAICKVQRNLSLFYVIKKFQRTVFSNPEASERMKRTLKRRAI